jgi:hypothetical protein
MLNIKEQSESDPTNTEVGNEPAENMAEDLEIEIYTEYAADIGETVGKETFRDKELEMSLNCWTPTSQSELPIGFILAMIHFNKFFHMASNM